MTVSSGTQAQSDDTDSSGSMKSIEITQISWILLCFLLITLF